MLKVLLFLLFTISANSFATIEPSKIIVISNGKSKEIDLTKLKKVNLETINYHPNFKDLGKIKYSGYLIKDILKNIKLSPEQAINIVGKTGQFSIELFAKELLESQSIIATEKANQSLETEGKGLQIIYDDQTISKYPHLKERQNWLWWVRAFIIDQKFKPNLSQLNGKNHIFKTTLPWPQPYGISSKGIEPIINERSGKIIEPFKSLEIEQLNGTKVEILSDPKSQYFLADFISNKSGAYSLHQIVIAEDKVQSFVNSYFFIKNIKVNK
ncbi:MAG: hypothetical protein ACOYL6_17500 [Bacteriovoracaceae bacterium]